MDHLTFAQLLGNYGEFVGAVAVVATLAYLAVQVRHSREATEANTKSLNLQSYQAWQAANMELNTAVSNPAQSEIVARGNYDSANLSEETYVSYAMFHLAIMQMAQSADYLYQAGTLDKDLWAAEMNRAAGILGAPGVRQWWDAGGKTQLTPQFAERLESIQTNILYWTWEAGSGFVGSDKIPATRIPDSAN
jgi:hypothetical protein